MSRIAVDLHRLSCLVERMASFHAHLGDVLAQADARVRELHGSWSGAAADAQTTAHQEWLRGATDVHEALGTLRSIAGGAHANYEAAVAANRRMWAR